MLTRTYRKRSKSQLNNGAQQQGLGNLNSARLAPEAAELSDLFRIAAHTLEGERIAILHVNNLPVLTFVADDAATKAINDGAASDDLVNRAESVALRDRCFLSNRMATPMPLGCAGMMTVRRICPHPGW
jgi:hypothetical protein